MSDLESQDKTSWAIVDRDPDRCKGMGEAVVVGLKARSVEVYFYYLAPKAAWHPKEPGKLDFVLCHAGDLELSALKDFSPRALVLYGGGGGRSLDGKYVIQREITNRSNAINPAEAIELSDFLELPPSQQSEESLPTVLRRTYPFLTQSVLVLCDAYLSLHDRLYNSDDRAHELAHILPDATLCREQLNRMGDPSWWQRALGGIPLETITHESRPLAQSVPSKVTELAARLKQKKSPVDKALIEGVYKELGLRLGPWRPSPAKGDARS
jgi:hypothetical protein